jgi:hypothetical protein
VRAVLAGCTTIGTLIAFAAGTRGGEARSPEPPARAVSEPSRARPIASRHAPRISSAALNDVVRRSCQRCHNATTRRGNVSLDGFDVDSATKDGEISEKVIAKLRAGMMPPPGSARPAGDTLAVLATMLESQLDAHALAHPNPGTRTFQRLNRAEYTAAIRDILGLEIDAGNYLPPDTKSENFDNIADVQTLSPTLLDAYLRAASEIAWLAVGNPNANAVAATYTVPRTASQTEHVEGAPIGTRGGISVVHTFPADGSYSFRLLFYHETTGAFAGGNARGEKVEISVDGERVALMEMDRWMTASDPNGVTLTTEAVKLKAGPHRVSAAFIPPAFQGVAQDLISPLKWSLASTSNATAYGFSLYPHLRDLVIRGPEAPTGVSDTPIRQRIFTCRPASGDDGRRCARSIISRIATQAYRRNVVASDVDPLLELYDTGSKSGGFEAGVRTALEGILASPDFVFRFERAPSNTAEGKAWRLRDTDLASRLAFFIWSAPPDAELIALAGRNRLSDRATLDRQVRRMLADPKASTLSTRFAAQWLRLSDVDKVQPDVRHYPDFDEQLRDAMHKETELFIEHIVRTDRSVLDLYNADYTFVNERLATHYGIKGVAGSNYRRVTLADSNRRGLLGHSSVLTLTSQATRTSPVERGKWVMEVFLNSPPPPPPPGVPDLEATPGSSEGRLLTVRERMEEHRRNPACQSCHKMMDPIGLALEHYDVTGRNRLRDNGTAIDSRGELWDGTKVQTANDLRRALNGRRDILLRTFTTNLMAYALGRRVEYFDQPTVRAVIRDAAKSDHKFSSFVLGIVHSPAFLMQKPEEAAEGQ